MLLLGKQQTVALAISVTEVSGNAPARYVRNPSVGREKDSSFILKLLPNSYNLCIFFLSHDCTICYPFWDKNTIEIKHANLTKLHFFYESGCKVGCHNAAMSSVN